MGKAKKVGLFIAGAAIGAGLGVLFAPKSGKETRKDLKNKLDELLEQAKNIDADEVKKKFTAKVEELKVELADMDKEKALGIAKEKGELAKEKGTPALKRTAESVFEGVVKVSKTALKKLEESEKEV